MAARLLIDADVVAYRAGFASEKSQYLVTTTTPMASKGVVGMFGDAAGAKLASEAVIEAMIWNRKELQPVDQALMITDVMIRDMLARYADEGLQARVFLSGVGNFRTSIATRATYKGNRDGVAKPKHHAAIVAHLKLAWAAQISFMEEADDLLGKAMTESPGSVCCSIDKDLLQIPGRHYNFVTKEEVAITPKQGDLNFYAQVLSGDDVDAVPGLPGVGPVKAKKSLQDCRSAAECWAVCVAMYEKEFGPGVGFKHARECASLVYVRRKVGELWAPPEEPSKSASGATSKKVKRAGIGSVRAERPAALGTA